MTYHIFGGPASPYSHKVRALFRYRRIPHTWLVPMGGFTGSAELGADNAIETPLTKAAKGVLPVVQYPDGTFKADSTPVILDLETKHSGRTIIPDRPALAFIAHMIEDMADEYLPFPMFYFRWLEDQMWCGRRQMTGWNGPLNDETLEQYARNFLNRQQGQLGVLRSLPRENVLENYHRFLDAFESMLKDRFFFFGDRPSLAEFGIYGQMTQYAVDPTVSTILKDRAVRAYQWTHFMDDLSGYPIGEWRTPADCLDDLLAGVIESLAPVYFMMANRMLEQEAGKDLKAALNGPKYRVKSYLQLKHELASLDDDSREILRPFLDACGCWQPLQFLDGEEEIEFTLLPS